MPRQRPLRSALGSRRRRSMHFVDPVAGAPGHAGSRQRLHDPVGALHPRRNGKLAPQVNAARRRERRATSRSCTRIVARAAPGRSATGINSIAVCAISMSTTACFSLKNVPRTSFCDGREALDPPDPGRQDGAARAEPAAEACAQVQPHRAFGRARLADSPIGPNSPSSRLRAGGRCSRCPASMTENP